ncbi:MAG: peptide chain release factor N(5)-glutamine methyltransferase [Verrucomicrobiae bacterium]|nr:peptide chain release factor N(5)-glutamine methyltransferase [Verrucomicrobiae bacterium]
MRLGLQGAGDGDTGSGAVGGAGARRAILFWGWVVFRFLVRFFSMATVLDTLQKGTSYLEKHGVEEARLNMQLLLGHALKCDRMRLYLDFDRVLDEAQLEKLRDLTKRRGRGEPLQHLLGTVEFCGREFLSDARALIPRPETEELVERLSKELRASLSASEAASAEGGRSGREGLRILDLGTGSGVIGLSLAADLAEWAPRVTLADVSGEALALAGENRARLAAAGALGAGEAERIGLVLSDLFAGVGGERYDLIAANLPYIPERERTMLSREVRRDPDLALFGGGEEGTEVMEGCLAACGAHLMPGGRVALEFGEGQGPRLVAAAEAAGLEGVSMVRDLCGCERFLFAVNPADRS